jgi:hypothetical protein
VLNKLELVREPSTEDQVVLTVLVVATDFLNYQALIVLIDSDPTDDTIDLGALSVEINFTFLIEDRFFAVRA